MMAGKFIAAGKWMFRGGVALAVIFFSLGLDPAPGLRTLQTWTAFSVNSTQLLQGLDVSPRGAEFMFRQNVAGLGVPSISGFSLESLLSSTGLAINEPLEMMESHIQPINSLQASIAAMTEAEAPDDNLSDNYDEEVSDEPAAINENYPPIAIYCTHSTETYYPDDNLTHAKGERGLINEVGLSLAANMSRHHFPAIFVDTIHDLPKYDQSYIRSRETVNELLQENPTWGVLIDVHRDSIPGKKDAAIAEINGKKVAEILILVGSDQRKSNPYWEENLNFAEELSREANRMYPGLIKGIRIKPGTYNQDLHAPSILLEVGNEYNSLEEAKNATDLFAEVLAVVLME
ncbi:MAG: stage II sporulation protein P [Syntrophomonadaceae bacterium]|nr:stage II sporulation protein P [Syntrophomonadaceae bacterium]